MNTPFTNLEIGSPAKKAALIIAVSILINAAFIYFMVLPLNNKITSTKHATDDTIANNERIRRIIDTSNSKKESVANLKKDHEKMEKSGVITPLLNSYAMRAKTLLSPCMKQCGLVVEDVTELIPIPLQQPQPLTNTTYCRQPIELTTSGSYTQMTAFISYVEKELPMATLSSLKITTQSRDPEIHKITLCFEWPAKTNTTKPQAD